MSQPSLFPAAPSEVPPSLALSLWQPMASALVVGPKRVENRPWAPPKAIVGKRIWIHAAGHWDAEHAKFCRANWPNMPTQNLDTMLPNYSYGALIGSVLVVGAVSSMDNTIELTDERARQVRADAWWMGPWGWLTEDPRPLAHPIHVNGHQKLWSATNGVMKQWFGDQIPVVELYHCSRRSTDEFSISHYAAGSSDVYSMVLNGLDTDAYAFFRSVDRDIKGVLKPLGIAVQYHLRFPNKSMDWQPDKRDELLVQHSDLVRSKEK